MALDKIWVLVDRSDDKAKPVSLELLTKAHEVGGTVEGVTWGDGAPLAAEVGAHGATALHTIGDLGQGLPGTGPGGRHGRPGGRRQRPGRHPGAADLRRP